MQRESEFATKITNNIAKIKNFKTTGTALAITVAAMILLSSPMANVVSVWAETFVGTNEDNSIDGTNEDDVITGLGIL